MMTEKQFKLTVQDNTNIEVKVNFTDVDSKGIIHIFHGMAEHMERYDKLAHALSKHGFDVIRHNHRGRGINIDESTRGHYDDMKRVIGDAFEVAQTVRGNVDKPYFPFTASTAWAATMRITPRKWALPAANRRSSS
ncbi:alpha/beta hydrolase [Ectopseudomonas mendocina]|uniref:alpha/beta hydrolase n=1 Tax=Ectopseudomonas mendocina TaxID=300 RepID=UPI0037428DCB